MVEDRVRGVGLGFERANNPSDRNIFAEVARMKKKAQPNLPEAELKPKAQVSAHMLKSGVDKKKSQSFKEKLIDERLERKKQKIERKKLQLLQNKLAKEKKADEVTAVVESDEKTAKDEGVSSKIHFKKNMLKKTRSR